ncbi:MAG: hypothetical protein R3Y09_03595 [Clostridia bacterium]
MIFQKIYLKKDIRFEFMGGDITSDKTSTIENVTDKIYEKVKSCMDYYKYQENDIWSIIQIFDTDGAYIPDNAIVVGEETGFQYSEEHIFAKDIENVVERNTRKRELMNYLKSLDSIKNIPYRGYYMSSNLDHALYNKQNLSNDEKNAYADAFYKFFEGKEHKFIDFLKLDVVNGVPANYISSWNYIGEGIRSLERHTNLHIYFQSNPLI